MNNIIVIADDDADDLFFAQRLLAKARASHSLVACRDGTEVTAFLERGLAERSPLPHAIFLDVKMPHLDGFETLKWIRARPELSGVIVIMLSGSGEPRDVALARALGADHYLVKYPEPAEVARVLGLDA